MFLQLFIINQSGGLIYNKNLDSSAPQLSTNEWLRLGSTFHGLHAISSQVILIFIYLVHLIIIFLKFTINFKIAPVKSNGIEKLETESFGLQCLQTLTGIFISRYSISFALFTI